MRLPNLVYADRFVKGVQVKFAGLNHNLWAGDGEIYDMQNLTSDHAPLLASRRGRMKCRTLEAPGGLFAWEGLCWVDGTGFYYEGELKGEVTEGEKSFAALGAYVVILPDKAWYNVDTGEFGRLEAEWTGGTLAFCNGLLYEEEAEANTIQCEGVSWGDHFKAGDAVTISGCVTHPANNKTAVIREIDGDKLYFYEYIFDLGDGAGYEESGQLSIKRSVPDMLYLCENENRLWGCDHRTIYASKPGDIFNWNVFDGLDSDSYSVDTGSEGTFTGCISYLGYPVFFKEWNIYKVYGSIPSNFQVMGSATMGVAEGSAGSLAVAGETLFYLSPVGWVAYSGGIPQQIGEAFGGERHKNAVAGSDGLKYYFSAELEDGGRTFCVYDSRKGLWHREDDTAAVAFARSRGNLYFLNDAGEIWIASEVRTPVEGTEEEEPVEWWAEFGDFDEDEPNRKGFSHIQLRLELDAGAWAEVYIRFNSADSWIPAGRRMKAGLKQSYCLPVVPRRGDHCRLKIKGQGGCRIHSLARKYYTGSELK